MVSTKGSIWTIRGVTALLWAAAAASAVYWGLRLAGPSASTPAVAAGGRQPAPADPVAVARLLGQSQGGAQVGAAAPSLSSRFSLVGVVADRSERGAALIAVDGRPAKPFRVGSTVDEGLVLQSVQARRAVLAASADGPAVVTLDLPPLQH